MSSSGKDSGRELQIWIDEGINKFKINFNEVSRRVLYFIYLNSFLMKGWELLQRLGFNVLRNFLLNNQNTSEPFDRKRYAELYNVSYMIACANDIYHTSYQNAQQVYYNIRLETEEFLKLVRAKVMEKTENSLVNVIYIN